MGRRLYIDSVGREDPAPPNRPSCESSFRSTLLSVLLLSQLLVVPLANGKPVPDEVVAVEKRDNLGTAAKGAAIGAAIGLLGAAAYTGVKKYQANKAAKAAAAADGH